MRLDKTDWRRKLSSRKFWALLAALAASCAAAFGLGAEDSRTLAGLITAAGSCAVYMLAEGAVDREHAKGGDHTES